jgi:hypothetical protein
VKLPIIKASAKDFKAKALKEGSPVRRGEKQVVPKTTRKTRVLKRIQRREVALKISHAPRELERSQTRYSSLTCP